MQAQQVLTRGSRKGIGFVVVALIVALGAVLAITFAASGSAKPSAPAATGVTTQPAGGYNDLKPDRTTTHGQLP